MTDNIAIKVENLSKVYKLYNNPTDRMKEALHWRGKKYHKDFYALNDVSFEVKKGETVGIIGKNGSGKSTLLKIITGVLTPTSGKVTVNGKVSALLELGAGFNPEYTGMENIYFQGNLMGYTRDEMESKIEDILSFADIGDFIHQPVKMYSSGMFARLAFAVAINVEPDILIVDEALSVGDFKFQQKCIRKLNEFSESGKTIFFVSHDLSMLRIFCDHGIVLNKGQLLLSDSIDVACDYYFGLEVGVTNTTSSNKMSFCDGKTLVNKSIHLESINSENIYGDGLAKIISAGIFDHKNQPLKVIMQGAEITVIIRFMVLQKIENGIVGLMLKDENGIEMLSLNSQMINPNNILDFECGTYDYNLSIRMPNLSNRRYGMTLAMCSGDTWGYTEHCWVNDAIVFDVFSNNLLGSTRSAIVCSTNDILEEKLIKIG